MRATDHIRSAIALATLLVAPSLLYAETIEFAPYDARVMNIERQPIATTEDLELALDLDTEAMAIMNELDRAEAFYEETSRRLEAQKKQSKRAAEYRETIVTESEAIEYRQQEGLGLRSRNHHRSSDIRLASLDPARLTQGVREHHAESTARQHRIERIYIEATAYATIELARLAREESQTEAIRIALLEEHREKRSSDLRATNNGDGPAFAATEFNAAINTSSSSPLEISANKDHARPHVADGGTGIRQTQAVDGVVQTSYFSIRNGYVRRWARTQTNTPTTTRTKRKATLAIARRDGFSPSVVRNPQSITENSITRRHDHLVAYAHGHSGAVFQTAVLQTPEDQAMNLHTNGIASHDDHLFYDGHFDWSAVEESGARIAADAHSHVASTEAMRDESSGLDIQSTEVKCESPGERGSFKQTIADNSSKQNKQAHGFLVAYAHVHADERKSKI